MLNHRCLAVLIFALALPTLAAAGGDDDYAITPEGMEMMAQDAAGAQADALQGRWRVLTIPDRENGGTAATRPNSEFTAGPGGEDGGGVCLIPFPDPSKALWTVVSDQSGEQARRGTITVNEGPATAGRILDGYVRSSLELAGEYNSPAPATWWVFLSSTTASAGSRTAFWLRLGLTSDGHLAGTRRFLGWNEVPQQGGGTAQIPCFYDFRVTAVRVTPSETAESLAALGYR